jgi:hypothetical protein
MNAETIGREQAVPESTKKRGRPSSGLALSAADRQRRRLEKLEAEGKALLPRVVVSQDVHKALAKFIQFKDGMTLGDALDRIVRDRLLRKRSGRHKPKPKQPPGAGSAI